MLFSQYFHNIFIIKFFFFGERLGLTHTHTHTHTGQWGPRFNITLLTTNKGRFDNRG